MHRIKVHGPGRDWSGLREALVLILFFVLLGVAAFQGGYIYRDREADLPTPACAKRSGEGRPRLRQAGDLRTQVDQLERRVTEINGRLVGVETTLKRK